MTELSQRLELKRKHSACGTRKIINPMKHTIKTDYHKRIPVKSVVNSSHTGLNLPVGEGGSAGKDDYFMVRQEFHYEQPKFY